MATAPIGYLDIACHAGVWGWVDIARLPPGVQVEVLADGAPVGRVAPTLYRADLAALHINGGMGGFELRLNYPLDRPVTLAARIAETGEPLQQSPIALEPLIQGSLDDLHEETRAWLERRFSVDGVEDGIYAAHQPIYGFRKGYSEGNWAPRYLITWHILELLAKLKFDNFLDAGGAEGYKAAIVKKFFGAKVMSVDLSAEACKRAHEIYDIPTQPVDLHKLPFKDGEFDVVLASETIEHVIDYRTVVTELLRVARKAVIITVPHEEMSQVAATHRALEIHGHIHAFDCQSFDYLAAPNLSVTAYPILSKTRRTALAGLLMEATSEHLAKVTPGRLAWLARYPKLAKLVFNRYVSAHFLSDDRAMIERYPRDGYEGIVAILVKDPSVWREKPSRRVRLSSVMGFRVPYHYPKLDSA